MKQEVLAGQTDYTVLVLIRDDAGAPKTALTEASIDIAYARVETDNDVTTTDVTPAALSALTDAHTDWGFEEVSSGDHPGLYRLDIADAVFAAGAWSAVVSIVGSGLDPTSIEFVMVPSAPISGVLLAPVTHTSAVIPTVTTTGTATAVTTVNGLAANVITATSIANDAITAAKIAPAAIDAATFAADVDAEILSYIVDDATRIDASALNTAAVTSIPAILVDTETTLQGELDAIQAAVITNAAGVDIAADIIALKAETVAILLDTVEIGAAGAGLTALATAAALATVDTEIGAIDTVVDSILVDTAVIGALGAGLTAVPWNADWDAQVESEVADALAVYDPPTKAELDAAVANVSVDEIQATALADLFNTDSATTYASAVAGSVVAEIADNAGGSALTAESIADAVWDEAIAGHAAAGSTGEALSDAGAAGTPPTVGEIADAVWDEAQADHASVGTFGEVATEVATVLVDTAVIGAAGAGLTALATQTSVDDLPTNAELATALGTADDAVLTAIGDLPTNAELATALGTADDAVLVQVALVRTQTDKLTFTVANQVDANVQWVNGVELDGDGVGTPMGA